MVKIRLNKVIKGASLVAQTVKNLPAKQETQVPSLGLRSPGEGKGNPLQYLPGEFCGQRSLVGYSAGVHKESDRTEQFSLSLSRS